jgi:hypothetical protein
MDGLLAMSRGRPTGGPSIFLEPSACINVAVSPRFDLGPTGLLIHNPAFALIGCLECNIAMLVLMVASILNCCDPWHALPLLVHGCPGSSG